MIADLKLRKFTGLGVFTSMSLAGGMGREVDKYVCIILIGFMLYCHGLEFSLPR